VSRILFSVVSVAALAAAGGAAQAPATARIDSRVLHETRTIDVALPASYATAAGRRYPVLVVLDGESLFPVAAALTRFYAAVGQLPEMIVIGIPNTDRTRDLSPPPVAGFRPPPELGETFGGAERFLGFLSDELLPYLDRTYRTVPMRTLVGHSIGGTFALFALARRPEVFTGYLVMEPAAWWNHEKEVTDAHSALQQPAARRARVVMVNGPGLGVDTTGWGGSTPLVRHINTSGGETHVSMPVAGLMQGLRTMFADFLPTPWRPGTRPIAMLDRFDSLSQRVGYDVTIPHETFGLVVRMSLDGRFFDDADRVLNRMEHALGVSAESREFRARLAQERGTPVPAGFVPLVMPAHRPTAQEAAAFLGRWESMSLVERGKHELEFRAAGDTVVAFNRYLPPGAPEPIESYWTMIQVTPDGTLEVGSDWLHGVPALLVFRCRVLADGTMTVARETRGFARPAEAPNDSEPLRYRRLSP
jgi:predicted alpha/beta superfamily hydrolase